MNTPDTFPYLQPGDWVIMTYGFKKHAFYVLAVAGDQVLLGKPNWCVSSAKWFSQEEILGPAHRASYWGRGQPRLLRFLLFPLVDLISPYSKPNAPLPWL